MLVPNVSITVFEGDVADYRGDLVFLKRAEFLMGADKYVANRVGFFSTLGSGEWKLVEATSMNVPYVLFIGVGNAYEFRYEQICAFARQAMEFSAKLGLQLRSIGTTIHGPGLGLDEREAFFSLMSGFADAFRIGPVPTDLANITIIERDSKRAQRLRDYLLQIRSEGVLSPGTGAGDLNVEEFGKASELKPTLFVAMPFSSVYEDEWLSFFEAGQKCNYKVERLDFESYVGDVVSQIKVRIKACCGLIVLLNGSNPNVFLELGYAWPLCKPCILVLRDGEEPPFDVRGQKHIKYNSVFKLRDQLVSEIEVLRRNGVFG